MRNLSFVLLALCLALAACGGRNCKPDEPIPAPVPDEVSDEPAGSLKVMTYITDPATVQGDVFEVTGTVEWQELEGGFWGIAGDDKQSYDPLVGMPGELKVDGTRVKLVLLDRPDLMSTHMWGKHVQVQDIADTLAVFLKNHLRIVSLTKQQPVEQHTHPAPHRGIEQCHSRCHAGRTQHNAPQPAHTSDQDMSQRNPHSKDQRRQGDRVGRL